MPPYPNSEPERQRIRVLAEWQLERERAWDLQAGPLVTLTLSKHRIRDVDDATLAKVAAATADLRSRLDVREQTKTLHAYVNREGEDVIVTDDGGLRARLIDIHFTRNGAEHE